MPIISGLEWTFNTVASAYEKLRPGYVRDLYDSIFEYIPLTAASRAAEVGIGGGQATLPILQTGCSVTAVDSGANFTELCKDKFSKYPNFSAVTGKFEDVPFEENAFDLVFSASAFHWIDEETGYSKVFRMLKSGGAFARFANHPYRDKGNPPLTDAIDKLYQKYYCPFHNRPLDDKHEYSETDARSRAEIAAKYGFTDIRHAVFHRTRTFTPQEYIALLGTYSDHIAIDEPIRREFFGKIAEAIEAHGGSITIYDTLDLQLARKP